jgi:hypothetical protein
MVDIMRDIELSGFRPETLDKIRSALIALGEPAVAEFVEEPGVTEVRAVAEPREAPVVEPSLEAPAGRQVRKLFGAIAASMH